MLTLLGNRFGLGFGYYSSRCGRLLNIHGLCWLFDFLLIKIVVIGHRLLGLWWIFLVDGDFRRCFLCGWFLVIITIFKTVIWKIIVVLRFNHSSSSYFLRLRCNESSADWGPRVLNYGYLIIVIVFFHTDFRRLLNIFARFFHEVIDSRGFLFLRIRGFGFGANRRWLFLLFIWVVAVTVFVRVVTKVLFERFLLFVHDLSKFFVSCLLFFFFEDLAQTVFCRWSGFTTGSDILLFLCA